MKYQEFLHLLLAVVGYETAMSGRTDHKVGKLLDDYGLSFKSQWEENALSDLDGDYRIKMYRHFGSLPEQTISLSGEGVTWFEDEIEENAVQLFESFGLKNPYSQPEADVETEDEPDLPVPSSQLSNVDWSRVTKRLGASGMQEVKERADALLDAIDQADMPERVRKNARQHALAVIQLVEAPDPPWREIIALLNTPIFCAILNVAALIQLIAGVF